MMMISQYAKEPWSCRGEYVQIPDEFGGRDCFVGTEANARRIVACVNACAGVSIEQLEQMRYSLPVSYDEVRQQRDQLLAALRTCDDGLALLDQDKFGAMRLIIGRAIAAVEQPADAPETVAAWCNRVGKITAIKAAADADGWIEWNGGECPAPNGATVSVKFRGGDECAAGDGRSLDWVHAGHGGDIVAYRVVQGGAS